mgnify:CR=1 FL=1
MLLTILLVVFLFLGYFIITEYKENKKIVPPNECEELVSDILHWNLGRDYFAYNNLFYQGNGWSMQIDHIVVSPYGIFVIETKGYKGLICGKEDSPDWTQFLGANKYSFYNPIMQNYSHCKVLNNILSYNGIQARIISIVVFGDQATLKCDVKNVVKTCDLVKVISQYHDVCLDKTEIADTMRIIDRNFVQPSVKMMKQHIKYIQSTIKNR